MQNCQFRNMTQYWHIENFWIILITISLRSWLQCTILLILILQQHVMHNNNNCCILCDMTSPLHAGIRRSNTDNPQYQRQYERFFYSSHGLDWLRCHYLEEVVGRWYLQKSTAVVPTRYNSSIRSILSSGTNIIINKKWWRDELLRCLVLFMSSMSMIGWISDASTFTILGRDDGQWYSSAVIEAGRWYETYLFASNT